MNEKHSIDFIDALQLLFIALKLTGHINWNWWLVLSPIVVTVVIGIVIGVFTRYASY